MERSRKSICSRLQFVTTRKKNTSGDGSVEEVSDGADNVLEKGVSSHSPESCYGASAQEMSHPLRTSLTDVQTSRTSLTDVSEKEEYEVEKDDGENDSEVFHQGTGAVIAESEFKKPLVKFTISVESNNEDEESQVFDLNVSQPGMDLRKLEDCTSGNVSRDSNSSLLSSPSLRLNLSDVNMSSPECGNSPEIRFSLDRVRLPSGESSLTSTPTSSRHRRQTFCGGSYLSRRNLSSEQLDDLDDVLSASSSEFSPGSTMSSLGLERFHFQGGDEFSDDGSGDSKLRESTDFSDDANSEPRSEQFVLTPVNKQLRIVTSVDRALFPHRRTPVSSPKMLNFGRSSSENLGHIAFVDFLKRLKLQPYLMNFPSNLSLLDFK